MMKFKYRISPSFSPFSLCTKVQRSVRNYVGREFYLCTTQCLRRGWPGNKAICGRRNRLSGLNACIVQQTILFFLVRFDMVLLELLHMNFLIYPLIRNSILKRIGTVSLLVTVVSLFVLLSKWPISCIIQVELQ